MRKLILLMVLCLSVVACSPQTVALPQGDPLIATLPSGEKLLAWVQGEDRGQLLLMEGTTSTEIMALSREANVSTCGTSSTTTDGKAVGVRVRDNGKTTLYLMKDANTTLVTLQDQINPMTCTGEGLQFSPDNSRVGYLTWAGLNTADITPNARLYIHNISDNSIVGNIENVAAFDLTANGAVYVGFFTNQKNRVAQVSVNVWDGSASREITTIYADEANGCAYKAASVRQLASEKISVLLTFKCDSGVTQTQYQLQLVDTNAKTASVLLSGTTSGNSIPSAQTVNVYPAPNGESVYFTLPDSSDNDSSLLLSTVVNNPAESVEVDRFLEMAQANQQPMNALPTLSADGRWLAVVRNTADNIASLFVFDLNSPTLPPIEISAGSQGDVVSTLLFSLDSKKLLYVSGGENTNNSVFILELSTGVSNRVARGRYTRGGAVSASTSTVALADRRTISDTQPEYDVMVTVDLASGTQTDVFVGATVADGKVSNIRQIVPLAWRR